jgi:hypothetical protein
VILSKLDFNHSIGTVLEKSSVCKIEARQANASVSLKRILSDAANEKEALCATSLLL